MGLPLTPSAGWTLPEGAQVQCPRGVLASKGVTPHKRVPPQMLTAVSMRSVAKGAHAATVSASQLEVARRGWRRERQDRALPLLVTTYAEVERYRGG